MTDMNRAFTRHKQQRFVSRLMVFTVFGFIAMSSGIARAECPVFATRSVFSGYAIVKTNDPGSTQPSHPLKDFFGGNCTTNKALWATGMFGAIPPIYCSIVTATNNPNLLGLTAVWGTSSMGTASNTTMNGCTFTCNGNSCRVRGADGLPVELMSFETD